MLRITVPAREQWDEEHNRFITTKETTLQLEHSLISLSKWESKWCKPFLSNKDQTYEQMIDYIRCMTISQNIDPNVYYNLTMDNMKQINDYISAPMTATWFSDKNKGKGGRGQTVTSELIYYWMVALNIPFECEKWHLNRLITLIRVCEIESQPKKKMSKRQIMSQNAALNKARRNRLNTKG